MKTTAWKDIKHKNSVEERERFKREAVKQLDGMGFAALRKARQKTQVELGAILGIDQASVSALENRTDLHLSTLAKYIRALGGQMEIRAVFPEATFNLEPLLPISPTTRLAKAAPSRRASVLTVRTAKAGRDSFRKAS